LLKVTVLGGSAAGGNTGAGCSGYLVASGGTQIVVDLGPGTLLELRKHSDFREINAIIISHMHVDHILDLVAMRFLLAYNPIAINRRIPLFLPPNTTEQFHRIGQVFASATESDPFFDSVFAIEEFDPDTGLKVGGLQLSFCPVQHFIPTWGMRINDTEGNSLGYSADTGPCDALPPFFDDVHTLICESTSTGMIDATPDKLHMTAHEAAILAEETGARNLVLTHMWEEYGFENYLADAQQDFSGEIFLASPGLTIDVKGGS
jgi:ribonuclease BN (tRNA processing enzyme)